MKKRTLAFILAALMALTAIVAVPVGADDEITSGDWGYSVMGGEAKITRYYGSATEVTIPSEIHWASVTEISSNAFYNCTSLTSVTIPDSVKSIGEWAFKNCTSLTTVVIPGNVTTIYNGAFGDCTSLTSVTIGNGVTTIGNLAFANCSSLTIVTIPNSVTAIGERAFFNCTSLTSIDVDPANTTYKSVDGVLYSKDEKTLIACPGGKTSVTIPDSVTTIGSSAFDYCTSLTSVAIPDSVTTIGDGAFHYCPSLSKVFYDGTDSQWNAISIGSGNSDLTDATRYYNYEKSGDFIYSVNSSGNVINVIIEAYVGSEAEVSIPSEIDGHQVTSIGDFAFRNCTLLTSVTIPDSVTTIGGYAFYNCKSLTSVTIGNGVTTIGDEAFADCSSLTSVTIPDSVTTIGGYAFCNCKSLTSVTIGNGVTTIDYRAFHYCTSLTSINVAIGNTAYKSIDGVLYTKDGTTLIVCPAGTSLTNITIPDSVTTIGDDAFFNCTSLTSITIPDSVTELGNYTFYDCTSLTSVTIPDSVTAIGFCVFYKCTSLTTVYYGSSKEQWEKIDIDISHSGNDPLLNANIIFNFTVLTVKPGDLTGDSKINSRDVIAIMKLILTPGAQITAVNDLNNDGKLNSRDVIALMKLVLAQS